VSRGDGCPDRPGQDLLQRAGEGRAGVVGRGALSPRDEAVRAHEDRAVALDLPNAQPAAARVEEVAVEVADPQRVERQADLRGERARRLAPLLAVLPAISRKRPSPTRSLTDQDVGILVQRREVPP
jgi:hypothetical protein